MQPQNDLPYTPLASKHSGGGHGLAIAILSVFIALSIGVWMFRQTIADTIRAQQFTPSSAITAMVERASLNDRGKLLLYASRPEVLAAEGFKAACPIKTEKTSTVLGCYDNQRIYLYDVTNAELDGIKDVTAAHEMLHAAYERLNNSERTRVDGLLASEFERLKSDQAFSNRVKLYDSIEPGQRTNELHSIIGTEIAAISPELERYYQQYFHDRGRVVALQHRYARVFSALKEKSDALLSYLSYLANTVSTERANYNERVQTLNTRIAQFNAAAKSGRLSSSEFSSQRRQLIAESDALEGLRTTINTQVADYEAKKSEYLAVNSHAEELNRSIDSSLSPAPKL